MNHSVNISKITPPYLPKILYRPRLVNLIEGNKDKKLILILGQAAQGKTTLAASYGKTSDMPFAWVSLDRDESDPASLFQLTVQSLQQALGDIDFSHLLSPSPPQITGPGEEIPLYREWAQSLFKGISIPVQIVMDGLDRLSTTAPGFKFLRALVEDSPPSVHLILLSREIPPPVLEFQHLKMRQQALVLTNEDLAFTQDEIKGFFQKVRGISFDAGQLRKIHSATDGWIGALVLFAEFLSRFQESTMGKFISEDFPDHFKKEIFQYFGKEIFSSLSEQVQEFLVRSSLIDLIEPAFMRDFLGMEMVEDILREHVRKNLFVHSFYDEKKGWLFQYHHFFRNFLKAKFVTSVRHEEQKSLLLKAGALYEQRGELENSVKYFLEANAYPQAASVITRLGVDLLQKGRIDDLSKWLHALPNGTIQDSPWLLFYWAFTKRFQGGRENLIALQKVYTQFKENGDMRGTLISLAQLIESSIQTGIHLTPVEMLIEEGEAALQQSEANEYPYESAVLWDFVGLGHLLGDGDIRKGIWACRNAYLIAKELKNASLQAYALCFSALGFVLLGEFSLVDEGLNKIEKVTEKIVHPEFRAMELMVRCLLTNHRGEFSKAEILVESLQEEVDKHGFLYMVPWVSEISAYIRAFQGKYSEAEKIGKQYLSRAISLKNGFLKGSAFRLLGLIYLHENDFGKAREAIGQSMDTFSSEAPSKYHLNRNRIQMGLVCLHLKEFRRGEKELGEALQYFSSISNYISLVEVHFAIAFLQHDQGMNDDAISHLQNGFRIAGERKYEYFYTLGTKYLVKACVLALELKVSEAIDYAAYLLSTCLSLLAGEDLKKLSYHPDSRVREKVWEIRRKIHRSKAPPLRIETLGAFRLFRGGSLMEEDEWDRSQPKKLLKAILSYGGGRIPKEIIIDELWPEESPAIAEKNFKTTLQRLRKSLEPFIDKDFGSSYIHLHDNIVFLDAELCHVDADQFLLLLKMAEEKKKKGDGKEIFPLYAEALEIYKGEFLSEELYAPWPERKREELRSKYLELLNKMANFHERQGSLKKAMDCYKKAIQVDPLIEESYQKLMTLYSNKGMYNEALRIYEDCRKALKRELKAQPNSTTSAIHKKILEKVGFPPRSTTRKGLSKQKAR
jgi:ATP/maltotriose-dependent transcriptional regulator MalT/DNA-binding SARP family transcriptional activator